MRAVRNGLSIIVLIAATACGGGSDDSAPTPVDFDHGTPATGNGGNGGAAEPPFDQVDYPEGPYGNKIGMVIPNLTLLGWKKPAEAGYDATKLEKVRLADYYNPDGSKPAKVLFLNSSAVWCGPCNQEYAAMKAQGFYAELNAKGVEFIGTLMEDGKNPPGPAKPSDIAAWGEKYEVHFSLAVDPAFKLGQFYTSDAVPLAVIIHTKTMRIAKIHLGGGGNLSAIRNAIEGALADAP